MADDKRIGETTGSNINAVLRLVVSQTPNGDEQLTILSYALAAGLKSCGIPKAAQSWRS